MKTKLFSIIITVLLTISTVGVCGQTGKTYEELLKLCKENDDQEACNQAERMKIDKMNKIISDGVDKQSNYILNSTEKDGTIYQVSVNYQQSQTIINNPNASIEEIKKSTELVLTPGKDIITTEDGDVLQTRKGFESYTNGLTAAIQLYNKSLDSLKKAKTNLENLKDNYYEKISSAKTDEERKKIKKEYDEQQDIMNTYETNAKDALKLAKKYSCTLSRSTNDENFKNKVDGIYKQLDSDVNNTISLSMYSKKIEDFQNLSDRFKECTSCGQ